MSSIYKKQDGNVWYYNISFKGKRYRGSTKTTDKKTAQQIANSIETNITRQMHGLPLLNNKNKNIFENIFNEYLNNLTCSKSTKNRDISSSKNFMPIFEYKEISQTKNLIAFLIYTGCRKGEALNLKWDNVDLQNDIIAIKGTKTKYDRYIPIHSQLKELLQGIEKKDGCDYVFNIAGKKLGDCKRSFHTACNNAGIKDMHMHDLRHVFASKMVMNGTSLYITGELLGHRTTQMTYKRMPFMGIAI